MICLLLCSMSLASLRAHSTTHVAALLPRIASACPCPMRVCYRQMRVICTLTKDILWGDEVIEIKVVLQEMMEDEYVDED